MTTFVEVAVNHAAISALYHYHLPPNLEDSVFSGSLVLVPFGAQTVQGIVCRYVQSPEVAKTKAVLDLLDPRPVLTAPQLALAEWLARETISSLASCFDLMLPPGMSKEADRLYTLHAEKLPAEGFTRGQARLVALLRERGALRGRQITDALHYEWRGALPKMEKLGWVSSQPVLPLPTLKPRTARNVRLSIPPDQIQANLARLGRADSEVAHRRLAILEFLSTETGPVETAWVLASAQGANNADLHRLEELGLVTIGEAESWRDPLDRVQFVLSEEPRLTEAQTEVWEPLRQDLRAAASGSPQKPHILYGITGSGKTEIYLQAVAEILRLGRQAVILVPEIALTPQTVRRFAARFPGQVGLVHSGLSEGERYDTWRRAREGKLGLVVGPRSALFTPFPNLGLIVVDEFHDESYYQGDLTPTYHAVTAAMVLARLSGALTLLGSATPDVALMERARLEGWPVLRLPVRILAHRAAVAEQLARLGAAAPLLPLDAQGDETTLELPHVAIVDMRQELKSGNRTIFSRKLRAALEEVLANHQQAILFLNRRGTATYIFCRDCGASLDCPRCDVPLTFHTGAEESSGGLTCHTCGYRRKQPERCPKCASKQIRQFGLGTEKVESEVLLNFPGARTLRLDAETAREKNAHDLILSNFTAHRADILVGTQMIAKGLDLPLVTLVGVILADVGLQLPDYRAGERGFQLLTQVAGRAGRSPLGGQAIFQTYRPDHYAIQAASEHDFESFLRQELAYRRKLGYPPYTRLARLELRDKDAEAAAREAARMGAQVERWIEEGNLRGIEIIGPAPCFFSRRDELYRWQIILRSPDPVGFLRGRQLASWRVEIDPLSLL